MANALKRNGFRIGRGNLSTRERVTVLRSCHEIPIYSEEQRTREGWLNLTEAARSFGISACTLRLTVERGELKANHPLPDDSWIINRNVLEAEAVTQVVARVARCHTAPVPRQEQCNLNLSMT